MRNKSKSLVQCGKKDALLIVWEKAGRRLAEHDFLVGPTNRCWAAQSLAKITSDSIDRFGNNVRFVSEITSDSIDRFGNNVRFHRPFRITSLSPLQNSKPPKNYLGDDMLSRFRREKDNADPAHAG
jgi:hypothetical protein